METLLIELGDLENPYPPVVPIEDVEKLRRWFSKNMTVACAFGEHEQCSGTCAKGSQVVEERFCLCPCHLRRP